MLLRLTFLLLPLLFGSSILAWPGMAQPGTSPTIRYVKPGGSGDGRSWASATNNLQHAINAVATAGGGQVWVAAGTYLPTQTQTDRNAGFRMQNKVAIYGGFAGHETSLTERPLIDPLMGHPSSTTLSGDIDGDGTPTGNSYHVFYHPNGTGLDHTAILDGFVITGGNAGDSTGVNSDLGGGMYNHGSSPELVNCLFVGNTAASAGGGMYNDYYANPSLINCRFAANTAFAGGGMYNLSSCSPELLGCSFTANTARLGGAMFNNTNASPGLTDCQFRANTALAGGGLYNLNACSPALVNCRFTDNAARGAAIASFFLSRPSLFHCTFRNNQGNCTIFSDDTRSQATIDQVFGTIDQVSETIN
ncbi:hypothetical protein GCM10023189_14150 [Nibrella saemangeumensis]|uniref:Right handed beta helix domain-containing protein n=1 Tax=Nibrella saemangeumensis TaxID=1084526 RepID=A0ABP8MMV4_9BACT